MYIMLPHWSGREDGGGRNILLGFPAAAYTSDPIKSVLVNSVICVLIHSVEVFYVNVKSINVMMEESCCSAI